MTPRERTVLQAIIKSLSGGVCTEMDALATSYAVPDRYYSTSEVRRRAALLLQALVESPEKG